MNEKRNPSLWTVAPLVLVVMLALPWAVLADQLLGDALVTNPGTQDVINRTVEGGEQVSYEFGAWIKETGNSTDDVFPATLDVTITRSGDWLAAPAGTPGKFTFDAYNVQQTGTIVMNVPCDTPGTMKEMTANLVAGASSNGKTLSPSSVTLTYKITAGANGANCQTANTAPTLNLPANMTVEGNAVGGANVTYTATSQRCRRWRADANV